MAGLLVLPDLRRLVQGLVLGRATIPSPHVLPGRRWRRREAAIAVTLLASALIGTGIHAVGMRHELGRTPRSEIDGAYDVIAFVRNGNELPAWSPDPTRWRALMVGSPQHLTVRFANDGEQTFRASSVSGAIALHPEVEGSAAHPWAILTPLTTGATQCSA